MNYYGQELNLIEENLAQLGLEQVSDLTEQEYFRLLKIVPDCMQASSVMSNLYVQGHVKVVDADAYVENIPMSTRVKHVLLRRSIFYLPQLSAYPRETIDRFRNLGPKSLEELYNICRERGIVIDSTENLRNLLKPHSFDQELYLSFFRFDIRSLNDFAGITTNDLYHICSKDYRLTMEVYNALLKNGVSFRKWEDAFLFELLSSQRAIKLKCNYHIETANELIQCKEAMTTMRITCDMIQDKLLR